MKPLHEWIAKALDSTPHAHFLFRVDAGALPGLSFGHLSRCLLLAGVLADLYECRIDFLMRPLREGLQFAADHGYTVTALTETDDFRIGIPAGCHLPDGDMPDWMIVDLPYPDLHMEVDPRPDSMHTRLFFIDDFRFVNPGADIYHNSSILAPDKVAPPVDDGAQYFLGPEYLIFDPPKMTKRIRHADKLLVTLTFGGSDPTGLTVKVLASLRAHTFGRTMFRIILGPGYGDVDTIRQLLADANWSNELVIRPDDIIAYLADCDLAVCSGGRTLYELQNMGQPVLPIGTTAVEAAAIKGFKDRNLITDGLETWAPDDFVRSLRRLCDTILARHPK